MMEKPDIQELVYHWADGDTMESQVQHEEVLEGLRPHKNLKKLVLEYFGGQRINASWMTSRDACFLQNLVTIKLKDCRQCEQVPTLGHLPHLEVVEMNGLHNLKCIGSEFYGLDVGICRNSSSRVARAGAVFPALRKLTLDNMRKLEEWFDVSLLPAATMNMEFFPCLEELSISDCPQLITIPGNLLSIHRITILSKFFGCINSPETLYNPFYPFKSYDFHDCVEKMCNPSLETAHIPVEGSSRQWAKDRSLSSPSLKIEIDWDSEKILILTEDLLEKSSKSLRYLRICEVGLHDFPNQLLSLTYLEKLVIENCENLTLFLEDAEAAIFTGLKSLKELRISDCNELICLPNGLLQPTLETLVLEGCSRLEIIHPDELHKLKSLQNLNIRGCPGLDSCWGKMLFYLGSLRYLGIGGLVLEHKHFPRASTSADAANVGQFPFISLEGLCLCNSGIKHLPDQLQHLGALKKLEIMELKELEALPEWLGNLSSLQSLGLRDCPKVMCLPEAIQRLTNLRDLTVQNCPLLQTRCQNGEDWHKIAHIPYREL